MGSIGLGETVVHAALTLAWLLVPASTLQGGDEDKPASLRGLLGPDSKKIRKEGEKTFIWAGPNDRGEATWYDFTGSPINPAELQFGIGKDRIRAIDDPLFVSPNDPRLLSLRQSAYRSDKTPELNDEIQVIGYADGEVVKAYPVALLDVHELVNDEFHGRPVTVGW